MSTPIRIRGKNKHRPSKKSEQTSTTSNSSRSLSQRTRGRPLSLSESSPSSTLSARPRSTPLKGTLKRQRVAAAQRISKKRKMHLSALEALPAELLQTIFIMSMNLNLPHASPRLASILSSDHVYMQLCLVAFGGDETVLGLPEVSATRSAILGQPWLTFDLLQRCEAKHFEDNKTIESGGISVRSTPWPSFLCNVQMPERLMRGPWSSDKVALLERLNAGYGVRIDWAYSSAGEVARASLLEATISGNFHVVSLLVETLRTRPTTEIVRQAVYGLSEEHPEYRWDYDEEGERCMILEILFNSVARTEDIDWDDAEITAWAVRAKDGDDWRGRWVLRSMRYKGEVSMLAACDDPTMGPP